MIRPRPAVRSRNKHAVFLRQAQVFAHRFAAHEGVVGVLLAGGVARGYADHFSDLDLAVCLARSAFERWTQDGLAPYPEGDSWQDGWHVDFDYSCYEDELESEWEPVKRWDRSFAVVLHDPRGWVQEMLARKAIPTDEEKQSLTGRHLILSGDYYCNVVVPSSVHRGDLLAAHHCLNTALDSLIQVVFLANDELVPFDKWALNLSYSLAWTPPSWQKRVEQAFLVRGVEAADVERRRTLMCDLLAERREKLLGPRRESLGAIEARKLVMLRAVREQGAMLASEFDEHFGLRQAIHSPLFHLLCREAREGQAWLVFDEGRLQAYAEQDFAGLLDWDQALLRALLVTPGGRQKDCGTGRLSERATGWHLRGDKDTGDER